MDSRDRVGGVREKSRDSPLVTSRILSELGPGGEVSRISFFTFRIDCGVASGTGRTGDGGRWLAFLS